jgi:Tol biopolymer transport system component
LKVPATGGQGTAIADIRVPLSGGTGAAWCPDGRILLTTGGGGVLRVSAQGGDLAEIVPVDQGKEGDLHEPHCLPDGAFLFVSHSMNARPNSLVLYAGGVRKELLRLGDDQDIWSPVYSPTGHILYHRHPSNAGIWALPFSLGRHEATGEPFMVAPDADVPAVSRDGTLVHAQGAGSRLTQMVWVDRTGKVLGTIGPQQEQWPFPVLSPDGRSVAVAAKENEVDDIWIHDVTRGTRTRLAAANVPFSIPAWSPDGRTLVFSEGGGAPQAMKTRSADGGGAARDLGTGWAPSYSRDGRYILYTDYTQATGWDLMFIDTRDGGKPVALAQSEAFEIWPRLSQDGRYVAYVSDESGADEVYIKRFPVGEGKWQVSVGGGSWPHWSPASDRLYYVRGDTVMEVDVSLGPEPRLGAPRTLFTRKPIPWGMIYGWPAGFDVAPGGDRFVLVQPIEDSKRRRYGVVVAENWARDFARPAP